MTGLNQTIATLREAKRRFDTCPNGYQQKTEAWQELSNAAVSALPELLDAADRCLEFVDQVYLKDHAMGECPTWHDGCHCTVETLVHNIERAQRAEKERDHANTVASGYARVFQADSEFIAKVSEAAKIYLKESQDARAERDAALRRAEAAEKEREDRIDLDVAKRTVMLNAQLAAATNNLARMTTERDQDVERMQNATATILALTKERDEKQAMFDQCFRMRAKLSEELDELKAKMPKWIPCTERMPDDDVQVLVMFENGHVITDWVDKDTGEFVNSPQIPEQASFNGYFATHWMPMLKYPDA